MSRRNVYMKYSDDAMSLAIQAVLKRNMSVRKASNLYYVPFSTLYGRVQAARAQAVGGVVADIYIMRGSLTSRVKFNMVPFRITLEAISFWLEKNQGNLERIVPTASSISLTAICFQF
ncbi:unnamed protein product [Nezara viridula]|uniref:HTH psq-type domain-containing protein n=1 Tax=Nezara viridula TaxID=85310 RepID=A0A9P0MXU0_NEZVI|nr:unnamed protein product [Nezara viridula]